MLETQKDLATRTVHIALGAPIVVGRKLREYGTKLVETTQTRLDEFAAEGEKTAHRFQDGNVVEEIQHRVDLDKVQDRVGKLRDQLEGAVQSWRESFTPRESDTSTARRVTVEDATDEPNTPVETDSSTETVAASDDATV